MESEYRWHNWAETARATPRVFAEPANEAEAAAIVAEEASRGGQVRVVGAGHSFTPAAVSTGVLMRLDALDSVEVVGPAAADGSQLVRVGAGIRLHDLNRKLAHLGLAMENLGDIDAQSIAGAVSTGTHGTGARLKGLASQVKAVRLIDATGAIVEADEHSNNGLFQLARLGLGSVGVLTEVTLRCVPAFSLTALEKPMPLGQVLESLEDSDGPVWSNDHFEFYCFPYTDIALTKANNRGEDAPSMSKLRLAIDDEVLSNGFFEMTNRLCTAARSLTPTVNKVAARALSTRTYAAPSHDVFVTPRRVRFREMEYALPAKAVVSALREVNSWIRHTREAVPFPIEVRFAAADDMWLSTAYGRQSAYIAVHQYHRMRFARYFRAVEDIMRAHQGRPHWGKMHRRSAADLAPAYEMFAQAQQVRAEADPNGLFVNDYTRRVFGIE